MSEELKRRRLPRYLLLPLVVTILLVIVVPLAALGRAKLIAHLAEAVAHGTTEEATSAVRTLARMASPPVSVLVEAAASPCGEIAQEARFAIGDVLRQTQRDINESRRTRAASRQLSALAQSLAENQESFAGLDYPWLGKTTRRVVRLANQLPDDAAPLVARHCDSILAVIVNSEVAITTFVATEPAVEVPPLGDVSIPATPMTTAPADTLQERLQQRFAALTERPFPAIASIAPESNLHFDEERGNESDDVATPAAEREPPDPTVTEPPEWTAGAPPRLKWTHPMFFAMPAIPIDALPVAEPPSPTAANPLREAPESPQVREVGDSPPLAGRHASELLARWLVADGAEVHPLEEELTRRGFGRLSERLVEEFFSEHVEDRLRLVDDVLHEPGVDARPWLLLLADDSSADVRLLSVTIMASSNDPELIEKAWQVAIRDQDPRIAGLADRLRERRAVPQSY